MDCIQGMQSLEPNSIDMVLTDPPYFLSNARDIRLTKRKETITKEFEFDRFESEEDYLAFMEKVIKELYRVCKDGAAGYMFCSEAYVSYLRKIFDKVGFKFRGVVYWHKTNPFPTFHTRKQYTSSVELCIYFSKGSANRWLKVHANKRHNFMEYPNAGGKEKTPHKTQKPLRVCKHLIKRSSEPGDVILDPFMGSGSTAIAALDMNRKFIGYEHHPTYCKYVRERFRNWLTHNQVEFADVPLVAMKTKLLFDIKKAA